MDSNHNKLYQKQSYYRYTKGQCGESRIRTHGTVSRSPDFKSGAIDQLYHLSVTTFKLPYELPTSPTYDSGLLSKQILQYAMAVFVVPRSNDL